MRVAGPSPDKAVGETLEQSVLRLRSCGKQTGFSSASTAQASRLDLLACDSLNQLEVSLLRSTGSSRAPGDPKLVRGGPARNGGCTGF